MSELLPQTTTAALPAGASRLADVLASDPEGESRLLHAAATGDSLSQLTLGMAHELNNLVGGISALSEIYLQGIESGLPIKDGLGLIHNSAGRLQKLLRQLTEINRHPEDERTYVNLTDLVRGEMELFAHVLPKSLRLDATLPSDELAVLLDETALRQVLLHLVLNLRDELGCDRASGTLTVTIQRLPGSEPKAEVRLCARPAENQSLPPGEATGGGAHPLEAQLRLLAARQSIHRLGGTLVLGEGEAVLTLSLIA